METRFGISKRLSDLRPGQNCLNLSTFQEQKKCCDDVETKFKLIQTRLNMSQQLSTLLKGVVKRSQHLSTNVERMLRQMLWPFDRGLS